MLLAHITTASLPLRGTDITIECQEEYVDKEPNTDTSEECFCDEEDDTAVSLVSLFGVSAY